MAFRDLSVAGWSVSASNMFKTAEAEGQLRGAFGRRQNFGVFQAITAGVGAGVRKSARC